MESGWGPLFLHREVNDIMNALSAAKGAKGKSEGPHVLRSGLHLLGCAAEAAEAFSGLAGAGERWREPLRLLC